MTKPKSVIERIADKHYKDTQDAKRKRKGHKKPGPKKNKAVVEAKQKIWTPPKDVISVSNFSDDELQQVYDEVLIDSELGERSLAEYAKICWSHMDGTKGKPYVEEAWHSDCLAEHFQALVEGQIRKLLVSIPPGHGKSSYAAVFLPTWAWIHRPYWKMAFGSYTYDNTKRDADYCIKLMQSKFWQARWGHKFQLTKVDLRKVTTSLGGARIGVSVGGHTLGIRADLICADDPMNIEGVKSEIKRATCHHWWSAGMRSRGDVDRVELVIAQRLHDMDLIGYLQDTIGGYTELILPAEYIPKRKCVTFTVEGTKFWEDPRTEEGEVLFPQKFPKDPILIEQEGTTERQKEEYSAMYQQDPVLPEGGIIKKHWVRWYAQDPLEIYKKCTQAILSCDLAMKSKDTSSWTVVQIWALRKPNIYLIDQFRDRVEFTKKLLAISDLTDKWNNAPGPGVSAKLVEDKASGPDAIEQLRNRIPGMIPFDGNDDKEERMESISWLWQGGNVYLPGAPRNDESGLIDYPYCSAWMPEFYKEITRFPKAAFNDQAVTMSQAMVYISRSMKQSVGFPVATKGRGSITNLRNIMKNRVNLF
jgi:predicted phage terminase large subunit-like protein